MSISETIIAGIITAMNGISEANGNTFTPQLVRRWDREGPQLADMPTIQVARVSESKQHRAEFFNRLVADIEVTLLDTDATPTDEILGKAADDVEFALATMDWSSLRANLDSIEWTPFAQIDEDEPFDGFNMTVNVTYESAFDDPRQPLDPPPV